MNIVGRDKGGGVQIKRGIISGGIIQGGTILFEHGQTLVKNLVCRISPYSLPHTEKIKNFKIP
jgi:hypothetical protein